MYINSPKYSIGVFTEVIRQLLKQEAQKMESSLPES